MKSFQKNSFINNIKNVSAILMLLSFLSATMTSCSKKDKDDDEITPATTDKGTLFLHIHNYIDNTDIGELPNIQNTTDDGRALTISKAQYYISDIQIVKLDGTVYTISGKRIYKTFDNVLYSLGEVPVGNYKEVRFKIGLDATTNSQNPSASPDSSMLKNADMWFGPTPQPDGYVFFNVQGAIDTTDSKTGSVDTFIYKIGTNGHYKQVAISGLNISIIKGLSDIAHMVADYNKLFNNVKLNQNGNLSVTTTSDNGTALSDTIASNIQKMFRAE